MSTESAAPPASLSDELGRGWRRASLRALLIFLLLALIGQALAFLDYFSAPSPRQLSIAGVLRVGALYVSLFHHAGIVVTAQLGGAAGITVSFALALLGVTALAAFLLYRSGKAVATELGGSPVARIVHGAKIAPAYAGLSLLLALVLTISPLHVDQASVSPSLIGAVIWPLLIAAVAGAAGGAMSARDELAARWAWARRGIAVTTGGWRMLIAASVLAFAGLLVLLVVKPDDSKVYFAGIHHVTDQGGSAAAVHNILVFPNETVAVLVPSMGGCDGVYAGMFSVDLLCYNHFPGRGGPSPDGNTTSTATDPFAGLADFLPKSGAAPLGYFLFLLVPLGATIWGGRYAAAKASDRREGISLAAMSGVFFGALVFIAAYFSSVTAGVSGGLGSFGLGSSGSIGPQIGTGGFLGIVWGAAGGTLGALTVSRKATVPIEPPPAADAEPRDSAAP